MAFAAQQTNVKSVPTACPKCGGRTWDNRVGKKNPRSPDFKCRDTSCDFVAWPPSAKDRFVWADQVQVATAVTPINPAVGDLPGDPAHTYAPSTPAGVDRFVELVKLHDRCFNDALAKAKAHQGVAGLEFDGADVCALTAQLFIAATRQQGL